MSIYLLVGGTSCMTEWGFPPRPELCKAQVGVGEV